jgi:hypothetical protein
MSTAVISSARPARVHKLAATQFDYNTVPASIRFDLQAQAKLIKKLIATLARELNRLLWADHTFVADRLMSDLEYGIEIEAGGTSNKDGLDIPDYLKRDAKAGAA